MMIQTSSNKVYPNINHNSCKICICKLLFCLCSWVSWYHRRPLPRIFEFLLKMFGLLFVVNSKCCNLSIRWGLPPVLMRTVTGCKLPNLGWNKRTLFLIFFFHFYHISYIRLTLKMTQILAFRGLLENQFLYCFIKNGFTSPWMNLTNNGLVHPRLYAYVRKESTNCNIHFQRSHCILQLNCSLVVDMSSMNCIYSLLIFK